jgi:tyrosyl-DNA phosphodiesterase 2
VVKYSEKLLREKLTGYDLITGESFRNLSTQNVSSSYYTSILIKKNTCKINSKDLINFQNTTMGRNLLELKIIYKNSVKLCVMTSHLESTADFSKERIEQLRTCFNHMIKQDKDMIVLFGGDLNLRDSELDSIGGSPKDIYDIWESTGKRKECLYTWDCMRNSNLKMNGKFKPRCRFDRLFYRPSTQDMHRRVETDKPVNLILMPVYFELEGLEKVKSCGRFCSDHWAIQAYLRLQDK